MSQRNPELESQSTVVHRRTPTDSNPVTSDSTAQPAGLRKSLDSQVTALQRMPRLQRQDMVQSIHRSQGNQHVQRLLAAMQSGPTLQARLEVSQPGDRHEEEADRVAHQVMSTDTPQAETSGGASGLQRKSSLEQRADGGLQAGSDVEGQLSQTKGAGSPLPDDTRSFMESRFNTDFHDVRVHTDSTAVQLNRDLQAQAFTHGKDIYFNSGHFAPQTHGGKELLAHELTHVVQQTGGSPTAARSPLKIQRWAGDEHRAFGEEAEERLKARMGELNAAQVQPFGGVAYGKDKTMSMGEANQLGGDHTATPEKLGEVKSANPKDVSIKDYLALAANNINHFFPLAHKEWQTQHSRAMSLAREAHLAYSKGETKKGDALTQQAIRTEAFAMHFLQDSYASGHQYPRALEAVDAGFIKTGYRGLTAARTYHDALNALPDGIDMAVGGKFHGDHTAQVKGQDKRVADESFNSFAQVLCATAGKEPLAIGAQYPVANPGPDVGKIMKDPDAAPVWYSMEQSVNKMIKKGQNKDGTVKDGSVTTSSGLSYKNAEVMSDWNNRKDWNTPELSTDPDTKTKMIDATIQGKIGLLDTQSDNQIVKLMMNEKGVLDMKKVPGNLTVHQTVTLCKALLSGVCMGNQEHAVLMLLKKQQPEVFRKAVEILTPKAIDSGLDGEEWNVFLLLAAGRFEPEKNLGAALIAAEKNDDAARLLTTGFKKEGIDEPPVEMKQLSGREWVGVIQTLLKGVCGDEDEDAIVKIVEHLSTVGQLGLVHSMIGPSAMDRGVDGAQWKKIQKIMQRAGYKW